jgi:protein O-GlcNAc transferase
MAWVLECHDRSKFETVAISWSPDDRSETRRRLEASFDRFVDVRDMNDNKVAELIRQLEIDILVDLKGFTKESRTGVLGRRPAPIQVNYLGYPETLGAPFIDYLIADRIVIPDHHREFYSEKVVALPHSYQANDDKRVIGDRVFTRGDVGLAPTGFVFCCFNSNYKITPRMFDRWMRILGRVEGSVLWLLEGNAHAAANLRKEAVARGVAAERLVFAPRMSMPDHLARHRLADLFLDNIPCNAHTTASDALWAGLPVLTVLGDTFAGRVAGSLLHAIGLPELVAESPNAYERMAIDLATHPEKLAALKTRLAANRLTAPLFDTKRFTRHIEAAYTAMYERHRAGIAPDHIVVPACRGPAGFSERG